MNKLSLEERAKIIRLLVEGNSMHSCARSENVSFNTVKKLLIDVGKTCQSFHNEMVVNVNAKRIECDEIWSFIFCKDRNVEYCTKKQEQHVGDAWTWVGMDSDTKLVISYLVGSRDGQCANEFMADVASRLKSRVQLSTDGLNFYITAVGEAFEWGTDFAQLIKTYGTADNGNDQERKYSPATCTGIRKKVICGNPDEDLICTSYIERQNLTMRMQMRRFTRLTNAFSKKIENHAYAVALNFVYYNFVRIHKTLRVTPAMEAKLMPKPLTLLDIVKITYADEIAAENKRLARKYMGSTN